MPRVRAPRTLPIAGALATWALACGGRIEPVDPYPPTPGAWDRVVERPNDAYARATRAACGYVSGALPAETLGQSTRVGRDIPIDTIVVVMMENHSFDEYLGHLGAYAGRTDIESAPSDASNPEHITGDPGPSHPWRHAPHLCAKDTEHSWAMTHMEWDTGKMDGFYAANAKDPSLDPSMLDRALWWYDERELSFYYELASTFAIGDHYFASVLGPTWPNRQYLFAATSFGITSNDVPPLTDHPFPRADVTVLDELEKRHVSWTLFSDGAPGAATVYGGSIATRWGRTVTGSLREFFQKAAAGTLPRVAFVDPSYAHSNGDDEHPPADVQLGERFVSNIIHAMFASPEWARSVLFVTYDEHGGYFDHLPPARSCVPDAHPPVNGRGQPAGWAFDRTGVRVPFIAVSPFAKKGYVGHETYDHTSITRFIEARFDLPALTARDANAEPPIDLFDFDAPPFLEPPLVAPPVVDAAELAWCKATLGK